MDNMKALKEITVDDYMNLSQNGARTLFDIGGYRVLDGVKDEQKSYFVKNFATERWYLIDMVICYELVTAFHCGGFKPYIKECLDDIVSSID